MSMYCDSSSSQRVSIISSKAPTCDCQMPATLQRSKTQKNPGKWFYGCANYKTKGCGYFKWYEGDEHDNEIIKTLVDQINLLKKENGGLEEKLAQMTSKYGALQDKFLQSSKNSLDWKIVVVLMVVVAFIAKLM